MGITPEELDARLTKVEADGVTMDGRVKKLEDDDAKVHGLIEKITSAISDNPKIAALISVLSAALLTWIAAKAGIVPGVQSDTKPVQNPPAQVAPVEPPSKLDTIRKNVKGNQ